MNKTPTDEQAKQIIQIISPHSQLLRFWPLTGGLSAAMQAIDYKTSEGNLARVILRQFDIEPSASQIHPLEYEFKVLQMTQAVGLPSPTPYLLDLSGNILDNPYLVLEYVHGEMNFSPSNLNDYLQQLARQLAAIHQGGYTAKSSSFLQQISDGCPELKPQRPSSSNPALADNNIRQILTACWPLPQINDSTLLHGDFWPGNSLWQAGELTAVIDWEDAKWGDPLIDLAISRLDIAWIFGLEAMDYFTNQYKTNLSLNYVNLFYWDLCAALRFSRIFGDDLATAAAYFHAYGRNDISADTILADYTAFINRAVATAVYTTGHL